MMKDTKKKQDKDFVDSLVNDYYNMCTPSVRKLAETHGVSKDTIYRLLKEAGVKMPKGRGKSSEVNQGFDDFIKIIRDEVLEGKITPDQAEKRYTAYVRRIEANQDTVNQGKELPYGIDANEMDGFRLHEAADLDGNASYWPNQNLLNTRRAHRMGRSKWGLRDLMIPPVNERRMTAEETIKEEWGDNWQNRPEYGQSWCSKCDGFHDSKRVLNEAISE